MNEFDDCLEVPEQYFWRMDFESITFLKGMVATLEKKPADWYPKHVQTFLKVLHDLIPRQEKRFRELCERKKNPVEG